MVMLKIGESELEVTCCYKNTLGFFAQTGEGLDRRTWTISGDEYLRVKEELFYERIEHRKKVLKKLGVG